MHTHTRSTAALGSCGWLVGTVPVLGVRESPTLLIEALIDTWSFQGLIVEPSKGFLSHVRSYIERIRRDQKLKEPPSNVADVKYFYDGFTTCTQRRTWSQSSL